MTSVVETCGVEPPEGVATELSVPLSFFDFKWLLFGPTDRLIFYDHPCSNDDFLNAVVPKLKQSLSLTLKHYLPVAATLLYSLDPEKNHPLIRYVSGDTAPLTIAVSSRDFDDLTGSHARDSHPFYDFLPEIPPLREEGEYNLVPLIALQATLFPGRGICIGLSNHHSLGDARSIAAFMWAWAEINKFAGDEGFLSRNGESLPLYDRSVLGDCGRLNDLHWNITRGIIPLKPQLSFELPRNRVRASFTVHQSHIQRLKNLVLSSENYPGLEQVSSFIVTAAYVWRCLKKSAVATGEEVGGDKPGYFFCPVDARGRPNALIDPPVPVNYFGNCLVAVIVKMEHRELVADDGFVAAAAAIADEIKNQVNNKDKFLKSWENPPSDIPAIFKTKPVGISGSPKFDLSEADFGWGKGRRVEVLSLDGSVNFMSLCSCDGGLVVGLSLTRERMEVFADIFENGLNSSA